MIELSKQIKHHMARGLVHGLLTHAGYRVISSGMEQVIREVTCLDDARYKALKMPDVIRMLPDYVVLDRSASRRHLVDVNYRSKITDRFMSDLREKTGVLGELTLVLFHGRTTKAGSDQDLGEVVRCCRFERSGGDVTVFLRGTSGGTTALPLGGLAPDDLWARMLPLRVLFDELVDVGVDVETSIEKAARAFAA